MSLTDRIKFDKDLNDILNIFNYDNMIDEINKYDYKTDLKIKKKLGNIELYSYLGISFDYMCRFILQKIQYKYFNIKVEDIYKLVAKHGYDIIVKQEPNLIEKYNINYKGIIDFIYNDYVYNNGVKVYDFSRILPYAYNLSKLEDIYRAHTLNQFKIAIKFPMGKDSKLLLEDLLKLFINSFDNKYRLREIENNILYNPSFGLYSRRIGGADADIIINDTLIDFKTGSYINYENKAINNLKQLVGYYILNYLNNGVTINKLALYFARYGVFIEKELTDKDKEILKTMSEKVVNYLNKLGYESILKLFDLVMDDKNTKIL